jgi:integrase
VVECGREKVSVYRRRTPLGNWAFMVSNYASGKRRFDSYANEAEALEAASKLARQLSERDVLAAGMTNTEAGEFAAAVQALAPFNVRLPVAAGTLAECLKIVPDLPGVLAAVKFYAARNRTVTAKPVADVVADMLAVKEARKASGRYLQDLRSRLGRFADAFRKDTSGVTTAGLQAWLDGQKLAPQSYTNFRRVLHALFAFAVARGYAADNPVEGVEAVKVNGGRVDIYTPTELAKLLGAASRDFRPCIAIGAFAGLRSAEIERLDWADVDFAGGHIVIGRDKAKTASRRVVPVSPALAAWLAPYAGRTGRVWPGLHDAFYGAQQATAEAAGVTWKTNALRHSFASYRFAQLGDAGRVAGEMGNSPGVVHKHYRELVKPADAERWFKVRPEAPANVVPLAATA